jgi:hypothetical protein
MDHRDMQIQGFMDCHGPRPRSDGESGNPRLLAVADRTSLRLLRCHGSSPPRTVVIASEARQSSVFLFDF